MKLDRVYHPISEWEEIKHGMWSDIEDRAGMLQKAIEFTGNHVEYGSYMIRVSDEWTISCENALTDNQLNQRAWIGHAACALAIGCPEDITRQAWGYLTDEQRLLANRAAEAAVRRWKERYAKDRGICADMGAPML